MDQKPFTVTFLYNCINIRYVKYSYICKPYNSLLKSSRPPTVMSATFNRPVSRMLKYVFTERYEPRLHNIRLLFGGLKMYRNLWDTELWVSRVPKLYRIS